jgi:hypothetical protein
MDRIFPAEARRRRVSEEGHGGGSETGTACIRDNDLTISLARPTTAAVSLRELVKVLRAALDVEPAAPDLSASCPHRGATDLHRWYRVEGPLDEMFDGVRAVAYGWRTEWCASCHLCHEDGDSFVPDYWRSPYDVPEAYEMKFAPRYIEAARQARLKADSNPNG